MMIIIPVDPFIPWGPSLLGCLLNRKLLWRNMLYRDFKWRTEISSQTFKKVRKFPPKSFLIWCLSVHFDFWPQLYQWILSFPGNQLCLVVLLNRKLLWRNMLYRDFKWRTEISSQTFKKGTEISSQKLSYLMSVHLHFDLSYTSGSFHSLGTNFAWLSC